MKKALPLLAIAGGVAALVFYKIKKDEKRKIMELDEDLLEDVCDSCDSEYHCEESLAQDDSLKENTSNVSSVIEDAETNPSFVNEEWDDYGEKTKQLLSELSEIEQNCEQERPIEHKVLFKNSEDMNAFKKSVVNKGYVVSQSDEAFQLCILHIAPLDEEKILKNVTFIAEEAKSNHGKYQGWMCKL